MSRQTRTLASIGLTIACGFSGYAFYKMNPDQPIVAFIFAFGLLGIMLSFLRNTQSKN